MSTTDTERYVRVTLLTFEGGTWISKEILLREVAKTSGSPTLAKLLGNKKDEIDRKRNRIPVTKRQYETLFPISGDDTNTDEWDLCLLIKIVLFLFEPSLTKHERYDLSEILRIRNEVVCHPKQSSLKEQEYNTHWSDLTVSICGLAFDESTNEHASGLVKKLSGARLDLHSSVDKLTQLCKNDEIVLEKLKKQKEQLDEVAAGVVNAISKLDNAHSKLDDHSSKLDGHSSKLDDVLSSVNELKRRHEEDEEDQCQRKIPILTCNVFISGKNEDEVKMIEKKFLTVMRACISGTENQTDDESVRNAADKTTEDIKQNGGHIESADKGSIILKIRCYTLNDLDRFLSLFLTAGHRYRLMRIESALNALLEDGVKVELVLPDDTIDVLMGWIDLCLPGVFSAPSEEEVHEYRSTIKLGIRCDTADAAIDVIRYLQSSASANRMNQIAEAVSEIVHDQIKIEATPDVEGFAQALRANIASTTFSSPFNNQSSPQAETSSELTNQPEQSTDVQYETLLPRDDPDLPQVELHDEEVTSTESQTSYKDGTEKEKVAKFIDEIYVDTVEPEEQKVGPGERIQEKSELSLTYLLLYYIVEPEEHIVGSEEMIQEKSELSLTKESEKLMLKIEKRRLGMKEQLPKNNKRISEIEKRLLEIEKRIPENKKRILGIAKQIPENDMRHTDEMWLPENKQRLLDNGQRLPEAEKSMLQFEKWNVYPKKRMLQPNMQMVEYEKQTLKPEKRMLESDKATLESEKRMLESEKRMLESEKEMLEFEEMYSQIKFVLDD